MNSICVYCGSSAGQQKVYEQYAIKLGHYLATNDMRLIYGAGNTGLMGILATTLMDAGGKATGIIPQQLVDKEHAHRGLSELIIVDTMHERKAQMAERADAFIAMPGGLGTFEELFEILTWNQLKIIQKPVGILNVNGFYDRLLEAVNFSSQEGFIHSGDLKLFCVDDEIEGLIQKMAQSRNKAKGEPDMPLKVAP